MLETYQYLLLTLTYGLGTEYIGRWMKGMKWRPNSSSQQSILMGPCTRGKLGPCARGSRGHGTSPCAWGAPAPGSCVARGHGVSGARAHGVTWDMLFCGCCTPS